MRRKKKKKKKKRYLETRNSCIWLGNGGTPQKDTNANFKADLLEISTIL